MKVWVTQGKFKIFSDVLIKIRDFKIPNFFFFPDIILETLGLCSTSVQRFSGIQGGMLYERMCLQSRMACRDRGVKTHSHITSFDNLLL